MVNGVFVQVIQVKVLKRKKKNHIEYNTVPGEIVIANLEASTSSSLIASIIASTSQSKSTFRAVRLSLSHPGTSYYLLGALSFRLNFRDCDRDSFERLLHWQ